MLQIAAAAADVGGVLGVCVCVCVRVYVHFVSIYSLSV